MLPRIFLITLGCTISLAWAPLSSSQRHPGPGPSINQYRDVEAEATKGGFKSGSRTKNNNNSDKIGQRMPNGEIVSVDVDTVARLFHSIIEDSVRARSRSGAPSDLHFPIAPNKKGQQDQQLQSSVGRGKSQNNFQAQDQPFPASLSKSEGGRQESRRQKPEELHPRPSEPAGSTKIEKELRSGEGHQLPRIPYDPERNPEDSLPIFAKRAPQISNPAPSQLSGASRQKFPHVQLLPNGRNDMVLQSKPAAGLGSFLPAAGHLINPDENPEDPLPIFAKQAPQISKPPPPPQLSVAFHHFPHVELPSNRRNDRVIQPKPAPSSGTNYLPAAGRFINPDETPEDSLPVFAKRVRISSYKPPPNIQAPVRSLSPSPSNLFEEQVLDYDNNNGPTNNIVMDNPLPLSSPAFVPPQKLPPLPPPPAPIANHVFEIDKEPAAPAPPLRVPFSPEDAATAANPATYHYRPPPLPKMTPPPKGLEPVVPPMSYQNRPPARKVTPNRPRSTVATKKPSSTSKKPTPPSPPTPSTTTVKISTAPPVPTSTISWKAAVDYVEDLEHDIRNYPDFFIPVAGKAKRKSYGWKQKGDADLDERLVNSILGNAMKSRPNGDMASRGKQPVKAVPQSTKTRRKLRLRRRKPERRN